MYKYAPVYTLYLLKISTSFNVRCPFVPRVVYRRLLFECIANRLCLRDYSENACLIIARVCLVHIYHIYCITLHCVIIIARCQKKLAIRYV